MFKDYYSILNISYPSNTDGIRDAYRKQSKRWHPDRNIGNDTTKQMQNVNEAYNVLINERTKYLYDEEYTRFKQAYHICRTEVNPFEYDYNISDEDLKQDINKAKEEAKAFVDRFLRSLRIEAKSAINGAWDEVKNYLLAGVFLIIIIVCIQMCA